MDTPTQSSSKKKLLFIVGGILIALIIAVVGWMLYQRFIGANYVFQINDYQVPQEDFDQVYTYYQSTSDSDDAALTQTQEVFVQNYVLRQEYFAMGNTDEDLAQAVALLTIPPSTDLPVVLQKMVTEDTAIKSTILPELSIKLRSGEVFQLVATQSAETQEFMTTKLQDYKDRFDAGETFPQLKIAFAQDTQLLAQPEITRNILEFAEMSPDHPILPGEEFSVQVFATAQDQMTGVFTAQVGGKTMTGIAYITQAVDGDTDGYRQWLQEKINALNIVFEK